MDAKFTSGQWVATKGTFDESKTMVVGNGIVCVLCNTPETEANAKLIANAPELLKALQGAIFVLRQEGFMDDAKFYEEYIKKATE